MAEEKKNSLKEILKAIMAFGFGALSGGSGYGSDGYGRGYSRGNRGSVTSGSSSEKVEGLAGGSSSRSGAGRSSSSAASSIPSSVVSAIGGGTGNGIGVVYTPPADAPGKPGKGGPFIYPVHTTGSGQADLNAVGLARDPEFAHGRSTQEQNELLLKLENDFKSRNIATLRSISAMPPGPAKARAFKMFENKAKEYAIKVSYEAKSYLPYEQDGVKADSTTHVQPIASSSWVGNVKRVSPTQVDVYLGRSKNNSTGWYTYGGTPEEVEKFLNSPSLGKEINNIKRGASSSMRKLW